MAPIRIKFDSREQYQLDAIQAVFDLFIGQPAVSGAADLRVAGSSSASFQELGVGNELLIAPDQVLANLQAVQLRSQLAQSASLAGMDFSVEMETGTGKTYVYLRTAYELCMRYGFRKFVIVTPTVAIREGVQKSIELTHDHFADIYDRLPSESWVYDADRLSKLRQFAASSHLQFLIVNIDSFNKSSNVIQNEQDTMSGRRPIEFIQACRPIVILDEPQNMESELAKKAIASLAPLLTLRYSATHRNPYNLVYRLDPVRAYELDLVKRIEVDSVVEDEALSKPYIELQSIKASRRKITATLSIDTASTAGVARKTVNVSDIGTDLSELSGGRKQYDGFVVARIDAAGRQIEFTNGVRLAIGGQYGVQVDEIRRAQVRETVREHLDKELEVQRRLPQGRRLKVLSLFFIDRVAKYVDPDGPIRRWFEEAYAEFSACPQYASLALPPVGVVHGGYFAKSKGIPADTTGFTQADDAVFALIMRDKERLLSRETPLRFIFSHSALREGWDNPNVFQICTLNETRSELKKRQEIGRGLRLPVDETGERCRDTATNRLTIVANESYAEFAAQLQAEIESDCGVSFEGKVANRRERVRATLKDGWRENGDFRALWERIKPRTRYSVSFATDELVALAAEAVRQLPPARRPEILTQKAEIRLSSTGVTHQLRSIGSEAAAAEQFPVPDVLGFLQRETDLTRQTLVRILTESGRIGDLLVDPQAFLNHAAVQIQAVLLDLMVAGIAYSRVPGAEFEAELFAQEDVETYASRVVQVEKSIQDRIVVDSAIERHFAEGLDSRTDVHLFLRLPRWFKIPTPVGTYSPDWAVVKEQSGPVYLVSETKGSVARLDLRGREWAKILCGKVHFDVLDVPFRAVTTPDEV